MNHLGTYVLVQCTYIQLNLLIFFNFAQIPKFNQNTANIVQHQTTDLIVQFNQSHPKPKFSTFDQK